MFQSFDQPPPGGYQYLIENVDAVDFPSLEAIVSEYRKSPVKEFITNHPAVITALFFGWLIFCSASYFDGYLRYFNLDSQQFRFSIEATGYMIIVLFFRSFDFLVGALLSLIVLVVLPLSLLKAIDILVVKVNPRNSISADEWPLLALFYSLILAVILIAGFNFLGYLGAKNADGNTKYEAMIQLKESKIEDIKVVLATPDAHAIKLKTGELFVIPTSSIVKVRN